MSCTPNPRRKPLVKTTRTIQMFRLFRDGKGSVLTPDGSIEREAYEAVQAANPNAGLPDYLTIPLES